MRLTVTPPRPVELGDSGLLMPARFLTRVTVLSFRDVNIEESRYIADAIEHAKFVELPGEGRTARLEAM